MIFREDADEVEHKPEEPHEAEEDEDGMRCVKQVSRRKVEPTFDQREQPTLT